MAALKQAYARKNSSQKPTRKRNSPINNLRQPNLVNTLQQAKNNPSSMSAGEIMQLQRTVGNRAVDRLLHSAARLQRAPDESAAADAPIVEQGIANTNSVWLVNDPSNYENTIMQKLPLGASVQVLDKGVSQSFNQTEPLYQWWQVDVGGEQGWVMQILFDWQSLDPGIKPDPTPIPPSGRPRAVYNIKLAKPELVEMANGGDMPATRTLCMFDLYLKGPGVDDEYIDDLAVYKYWSERLFVKSKLRPEDITLPLFTKLERLSDKSVDSPDFINKMTALSNEVTNADRRILEYWGKEGRMGVSKEARLMWEWLHPRLRDDNSIHSCHTE